VRRSPAVALSILLLTCLVTCRDFPTEPEPAATPEGAAVPSTDEESPQAREDRAIPNRYLVIFRQDMPDVQTAAQGMASAHGLKIRHVYRNAIRGFAAEFPEAGQEAVLEALERNPNVRYIEQDRKWFIDADEAVPVTSTVLVPPTPPSNLAAVTQSSSTIALSWTDNSGDETGFQVLRCQGAGCSNFVEVTSTKKDETTFTDSGLNPDTEYCYEVTAIGGRGRNVEYSAPAGPACATTDPGAPPADDRPTNLTATANGSTSIDLSWTDNSNETGFEIERCQGTGCSDFSLVGQVGQDVTTYSDTGLGVGQEYCYRVRGFRSRGKNSTQTLYSNTSCATTDATPPATDPPTNLQATANGTSSIDLSWTDNSDEDTFDIERCQGTGCSTFAPLTQVGADVTAYSDGSLSASTTYCYRVQGNVGGTPTGWSNTSCATTDATPPSGLFVDDDFDDAAGTPLHSHTGAIGATWSPHPSSATSAVIAPNGSEVQSTGEAVYMASGSPPGADYRVASHMYFYRASGGSVTYSFVVGRMNQSSKTMYMFGFVYSWVNRWELKKFVNGVETLLATSTENLPAVGDSRLVDLQMEGTTIRGVVNGVELVSVTDGDISAAGRAGLRILSGNEDWAALTDFEATTLDLAPPPMPKSTDPPSNLTATVATSTSVALSWTDNSDEDVFEIERCEGSGCNGFAFLAQVGKNIKTYTDGGLASDVEVCYRVRGIVDGAPTGYSNVACALPQSVPPLFVEDAFEDSPGTLLQSHVGTTGAAWTLHPSSSGSASFAPDGSEIQSTADASYTASGAPPGPDYRVASWLYFHTVGNNETTYTFVTGRMDESSRTMYMFGYVYSYVNRWELKKFVNGVESLLGYSTERLPLQGDVRLVDLQMEGNTIRGFVNGYELVSAVDGAIPGPGRAGLRIRSGNQAFAAMTDFEATTLDLAPPPIPPKSDPPTNLTATGITSTNVTLSWTDNSEEDTFEVERCVGSGCANFAFLAEVGRNVRSYTDSGLTPGVEVCYRVRGIVLGTPTDYSNVACATPTAPPPGQCPDAGNHDDLTQLWGITRTHADQNPTWRGTQQGGQCAIQGWYFGIDSGVDIDHPDLNVVEAVDFYGDGSGGEDGHGHGTHTAGTAAAKDGNGGVVGMAPGAPVFGFKVCGDDGSCDLSAIVAAIDEVTARKIANPSQPMVANMSLGGDPSPTMEEAVRRSVATGVPYALGAGNGVFGACLWPADAQNFSPALVGDDDITASGGTLGDTKPINGAITVTSSNQNDADDDCNYGAPVTVAAPGVAILSTSKNGGYDTLSGTSMATPHVAGAVLLYLQSHPDATPQQVEAAIVALLEPWTTDDLPNASGRLNAGSL